MSNFALTSLSQIGFPTVTSTFNMPIIRTDTYFYAKRNDWGYPDEEEFRGTHYTVVLSFATSSRPKIYFALFPRLESFREIVCKMVRNKTTYHQVTNMGL